MGAVIHPPQGNTFAAPFRVYKVTRAFGSALFNAAATTDSEEIFTLPANSFLLYADATLDVAFVATGLTDVDIALGDAGDNDGILAATMDMQSDAAGTRYTTKGAYFTTGLVYTVAAAPYTAYVTATGANLSTLTAGQVTFTFVTIERGA